MSPIFISIISLLPLIIHQLINYIQYRDSCKAINRQNLQRIKKLALKYFLSKEAYLIHLKHYFKPINYLLVCYRLDKNNFICILNCYL
jgi:hypothetical protein